MNIFPSLWLSLCQEFLWPPAYLSQDIIACNLEGTRLCNVLNFVANSAKMLLQRRKSRFLVLPRQSKDSVNQIWNFAGQNLIYE